MPTLTPAQAESWHAIEASLIGRDSTPFLLHGVTGSGKTEVYLRSIGWCLRHDRSAIVLAPEIALASQVVRRVTARFPGRVAVLHSALPEGERAAAWAAIAGGHLPVVVGPRSALFAPVANLGIVVLDEEHDGAYKQDAEPRYHARALAEEIGRRRGAVVVLGSATPAVETNWRAEDGLLRPLRLPDRVGPAMARGDDRRTGDALELPPVETVDLRLELHRGNPLLLGERLLETLQRTLARREQAILFLNRRGLATVVLCRSCGRTLLCPYCDIPLVYHADRGWLLCHRCDFRQPPATSCSECGGSLNYFGAGTQRVEAEVRRLLPAARVLRWDQDTVRRRGGHEALLRQVERHEADIVVGTQMIAKGLDLPLVTAVGVVNADTMLHLPDFRSAERTFQLLTQVAGRAGRRGPGSVVIVQSYTPDHYAIRAAARHDYAAFYGEEIAFRRTHRYPPFVRLVRYLVRDADEARCAAHADEMARRLARHARDRGVEMDLLGPTPAFATKARGLYQWQIVLRTADLEPLLDGLPAPPGWAVDVDPQSLL
ncbi:MAG: primosomal protein N' [Chloroflexia bacterium]|nr:primosomal protein N' [Chloroflexia bacterium]